MNAQLVGKPAEYIARIAGVSIPKGTRVLLGEETRVGPKFPYSKEKLMPVLGFYVEENWEKACARCIEILTAEGAGHTMTIHSKNEAVIREFGLKKPVSRLIVNSPAALAGIGATTSLAPSLTLGCGAIGKNASSDNIGPQHLINIRRMAYGIREIEDIRPQGLEAPRSGASSGPSMSDGMVDALVQKIVERLKAETGKL
jgi:acyl-CoA reductase-like NAD-dependent aldehyde dehydrogenase